jgi:hypothetical protein
MIEFLLLSQLVSTLLMVGIIWFVQVVHYPLMACIGPERCTEYSRLHQSRTTWIVVGPMLVEVLSAIGIIVLSPALRVEPPFLVASGILAIIWLVTASIMVPAHAALLRGFYEQKIHRLVRTNWIRTIAWTIRGALILWICSQSFVLEI